MYKIENINDYLDNKEIFNKLITDIYNFIYANIDYPNFKKWFYDKQTNIKSLKANTRTILFIRNNNEVIAVACLKNENNEKKICTLLVNQKNQQQNLATSIIEESFKWLNTATPLATIHEDKVEIFKPIITKYNWNLCQIVPSAYNNNQDEYCFNGYLVNNKDDLRKELYKRLIKAIKKR